MNRKSALILVLGLAIAAAGLQVSGGHCPGDAGGGHCPAC